MRIKKSSKSTLMRDNTTNEIVSDSISMLREAGFNDDYIDQFADQAVSVLDDYAELIGEGTKVEYSLMKRLTEIELKVLIPGESYDPFASGREAQKRNFQSLGGLNLNAGTACVSHKYAFGYNALSVSVPLTERRKTLLKDPILFAVILGVILGLVCQHLPDTASTFIIDGLASPLI